ncbi:MAG: hypothetical protein LIP23_09400, partial [Planctomycetes bacterium]|nr:hypothetical protein [Planctomycetota bacterium]
MSLRKKLFLRYAIMILLVIFTGAMAIRAFWRTSRTVEEASGYVSSVSKVLVPANQLVSQVYTDINQAALYMHAYSFNRMNTDYDQGIANINQVRDRVNQVRTVVNSPDAAILSQTRQSLEQAVSDADAMSKQAGSLHASMQKVDELQGNIDQVLTTMQEVMDVLYETVIANISSQLMEESAEGMAAYRQTVINEWNFLDEVYNA